MTIVKGEKRGQPGRWIVDFRDQFGVPSFKTKAEAEEFRDKVSDEVGRRVFMPAKRMLTFREASTEWLRDKERLERATYEYYRGHVALHLLPRIGDYRLDHIDVRTIEERVRDAVAKAAGARRRTRCSARSGTSGGSLDGGDTRRRTQRRTPNRLLG